MQYVMIQEFHVFDGKVIYWALPKPFVPFLMENETLTFIEIIFTEGNKNWKICNSHQHMVEVF